MKILVVDDEELTRRGIISSICWNELGIDEIYEANDGINGLRAAQTHKPDIILSDVRMPRMDGIIMMNKIETQLPDTVFIFMSGYSDKEYLKAALKLQAVSYIEKPLNKDEITEAIRESVKRRKDLIQTHRAETIRNTVSASQLAFWLTLPYESSKTSVDSLSYSYCQKYGSPDLFHSAVTLIVRQAQAIEQRPDFLEEIQQKLHDLIRPLHLHVIGTEKKMHHFVFHIFRKEKISSLILNTVEVYLQRLFAPYGKYIIASGSCVSGISHLYKSYTSAVIALQTGFFFDSGSVLRPQTLTDSSPFSNLDSLISKFHDSLETSDEKQVLKICDTLYQTCYHNTHLLTKQIQANYFQLLTILFEQRRHLQLEKDSNCAQQIFLDIIEQCFLYKDLHQYLLNEVSQFFVDKNSYIPENSTIYMIKNFISQNYKDPALSIKNISDYVCLSVSYICTVFKSETGQTLNQYLTEYRMQRAKQLLDDPRNTISSISSMVGYNDGNYFGKTFKKFTGYSPSEYRESRERL